MWESEDSTLPSNKPLRAKQKTANQLLLKLVLSQWMDKMSIIVLIGILRLLSDQNKEENNFLEKLTLLY